MSVFSGRLNSIFRIIKHKGTFFKVERARVREQMRPPPPNIATPPPPISLSVFFAPLHTVACDQCSPTTISFPLFILMHTPPLSLRRNGRMGHNHVWHMIKFPRQAKDESPPAPLRFFFAGAHGSRRARPLGGVPHPAGEDADRLRPEGYSDAPGGALGIDGRGAKVSHHNNMGTRTNTYTVFALASRLARSMLRIEIHTMSVSVRSVGIGGRGAKARYVQVDWFRSTNRCRAVSRWFLPRVCCGNCRPNALCSSYVLCSVSPASVLRPRKIAPPSRYSVVAVAPQLPQSPPDLITESL